ncbi:MAG: PAS domain S-box protein [Proteobacteria bacterium]|nr:PAS domain S-box protein [Pseudomonadota bacterium]
MTISENGRTKGLLFPKCLHRPSAREAVLLLALAGLGLAGNYLSVPMFFGVDFLFGSIAVLVAVRLSGAVWGLPVAALAAGYTFVLWGHPYAVIIFTAEAFVVGFFTCRFKRENLVLVDAGFWLLLGLPMVWVFYSYSLGMDPTAVQLIMLKQGINGIFNALIANILLHGLPLERWIGRGARRARVSLQQSFFNTLSAFILIPLLLTAMIGTRAELGEIKGEIREYLGDEVADLDRHLNAWYGQHAAMLRLAMANALRGGPEHRDGNLTHLEEVAREIPGLLKVQYTAPDGRIVLSYPERDDRGVPYAGRASSYREHFARAAGGAITLSDVHDDEMTPRAHFTIIVPLDGAGAGGGFVVASLAPDHLNRILNPESHNGALRMMIVDRENRIVGSSDPAFEPMAAFSFGRGGELVALGEGYYHWLPESAATLPEMRRWKRSYFFARVPLSGTEAWSIVVGVPMARYVDKLRADTIDKLVLVFAFSILGFFLVPLFSRRLAAPLERLSAITERIVETQGMESPTGWPRSKVLEVDTLTRGFRSMVDSVVKAGAENRRIAEDLAQLIDTANAPIFGTDMEGRVTEWNQTAARITGYAKTEVLDHDLVEALIPEPYQASVRAVLDNALQGKDTANYEFPLYTKAGKRVDLLLNATARRDTEGNIVGVVGIGQDITELKRAEAQVIQAAKMATLGEMATGVAHELNQPLNVIRMAAESSAERIEDGEIDGEWLRGKLERISAQTARAAAIIDHMRIFGRKADETPVEFHPRDAVEGALGLIGEQLRLLDIEVETVFSEPCQKVVGHAVQLEQVVLNLLANARDAMGAKGRDRGEPRKISLIVEALDSNNTLRLIVRDTGGGIPEDCLSHIFEPFFTTKEVGKGTGLGLSVSYGIITDMGGTLEAVNTQDGAQFTIKLPVVERRPVTAGAVAG